MRDGYLNLVSNFTDYGNYLIIEQLCEICLTEAAATSSFCKTY